MHSRPIRLLGLLLVARLAGAAERAERLEQNVDPWVLASPGRDRVFLVMQQMAVFRLKTLLGSSYVPPACAGVFTDTPCSNPFAPWIEDLVARSITAGCGGENFCPANSATRGQMAAFLVKTFGLKLYGP